MEPEVAPFELPGADGEAVRGEVRALPGGGPRPAVVVMHGFKGFRGWGFFPWLGRRLAEAGFAGVTFDFSHNGTDASGSAYPRKDLFERSTWRTHQEDLRAVLAALRGRAFPAAARADPARLALLGHSLGGGLAVLQAAADPGVRAVVGWAPVSTPGHSSPEENARWRRLGRLPIVNSRTGEVLPLGTGFLDDLEARREALDVVAAAGRGSFPLLVVHGEEDTSVPPREGRALVEARQAAGRGARLALLPGTQHTFDAVHPFAGPTPALEKAWAETVGFLRTCLLPEER